MHPVESHRRGSGDLKTPKPPTPAGELRAIRHNPYQTGPVDIAPPATGVDQIARQTISDLHDNPAGPKSSGGGSQAPFIVPTQPGQVKSLPQPKHVTGNFFNPPTRDTITLNGVRVQVMIGNGSIWNGIERGYVRQMEVVDGPDYLKGTVTHKMSGSTEAEALARCKESLATIVCEREAQLEVDRQSRLKALSAPPPTPDPEPPAPSYADRLASQVDQYVDEIIASQQNPGTPLSLEAQLFLQFLQAHGEKLADAAYIQGLPKEFFPIDPGEAARVAKIYANALNMLRRFNTPVRLSKNWAKWLNEALRLEARFNAFRRWVSEQIKPSPKPADGPSQKPWYDRLGGWIGVGITAKLALWARANDRQLAQLDKRIENKKLKNKSQAKRHTRENPPGTPNPTPSPTPSPTGWLELRRIYTAVKGEGIAQFQGRVDNFKAETKGSAGSALAQTVWAYRSGNFKTVEDALSYLGQTASWAYVRQAYRKINYEIVVKGIRESLPLVTRTLPRLVKAVSWFAKWVPSFLRKIPGVNLGLALCDVAVLGGKTYWYGLSFGSFCLKTGLITADAGIGAAAGLLGGPFTSATAGTYASMGFNAWAMGHLKTWNLLPIECAEELARSVPVVTDVTWQQNLYDKKND